MSSQTMPDESIAVRMSRLNLDKINKLMKTHKEFESIREFVDQAVEIHLKKYGVARD